MAATLLRLKELRKAAKVSQEVVAEGIGADKATVSRHEREETWPDDEYFRKYAKYYKVHPAALFADAKVVDQDALICPAHLAELIREAEGLEDPDVRILVLTARRMNTGRAA